MIDTGQYAARSDRPRNSAAHNEAVFASHKARVSAIAGYCVTNYAVQCTDVDSGKVGCFLFDIAFYQMTGEFKAVSPVFPGLAGFYAWDKANGDKRKAAYIERKDAH